MNSPKIKTLAYVGLVRPALEYAATVLDPYMDINTTTIPIKLCFYAFNRFVFKIAKYVIVIMKIFIYLLMLFFPSRFMYLLS